MHRQPADVLPSPSPSGHPPCYVLCSKSCDDRGQHRARLRPPAAYAFSRAIHHLHRLTIFALAFLTGATCGSTKWTALRPATLHILSYSSLSCRCRRFCSQEPASASPVTFSVPNHVCTVAEEVVLQRELAPVVAAYVRALDRKAQRAPRTKPHAAVTHTHFLRVQRR
jgi:hypothetical protein